MLKLKNLKNLGMLENKANTGVLYIIRALFVCHVRILKNPEKACKINGFIASKGVYCTTTTQFMKGLWYDFTCILSPTLSSVYVCCNRKLTSLENILPKKNSLNLKTTDIMKQGLPSIFLQCLIRLQCMVKKMHI